MSERERERIRFQSEYIIAVYTHFASIVRATTPERRGAAALVPVNSAYTYTPLCVNR